MPLRSPLSVKSCAFALLSAALLMGASAQAAETDCLVRDPSTIVKASDGTYWIYGTGRGVQQFSSKDRLHWTQQGPIFPARPDWTTTLTGNRDNIAWAPDIHRWGGKYYLYYSYSAIGSKFSGIGVATNATPNLDPKGWVDQGVVIHSGKETGFNTIDPCIFADVDGGMWLSFGSYFDGIHLIRIDAKTGKQSADDTKIYTLAEHPQDRGNSIEASAVYYHDGYYYLFVNWGGCLAGPKSTYNIRFGRSKSVTGPYVDKDGKAMTEGGGSLFLGSMTDNGSGRPCDEEVGPGHVGILSEKDGDWVSTHYEWARDKNGKTTVNVDKLAWDSDGWPRVVLDPGPYRIVSALTTHNVVSGGAEALQTSPYTNAANQKWTLDYQGDGYYRILSGGKALGIVDNSATPGAKTALVPAGKQDSQLWYLQQNEDGTYTLLPKSGGKAVALDVTGCSPNDGALLQQWTVNGMNCQKFSFYAVP